MTDIAWKTIPIAKTETKKPVRFISCKPNFSEPKKNPTKSEEKNIKKRDIGIPKNKILETIDCERSLKSSFFSSTKSFDSLGKTATEYATAITDIGTRKMFIEKFKIVTEPLPKKVACAIKNIKAKSAKTRAIDRGNETFKIFQVSSFPKKLIFLGNIFSAKTGGSCKRKKSNDPKTTPKTTPLNPKNGYKNKVEDIIERL